MIRNGLKTFVGNFVLAWKHALYLIVSFGIIAGLFVWSSLPIVDKLRESGWVMEMYEFFELFYTDPKLIADRFTALVSRLYRVLYLSAPAVWGNYALSLILLLVVPSFVYYVGEYTLGECLGAKMSSQHNASFMHRLVSTIGRSSLYALWKTLLSLPFIVIILSLCFAYVSLATSFAGAWLLLPVLIGLVLLVLSCRFAFFGGYLPVSVFETGNVIKTFASSISELSGGYFKKVLNIWGLFMLELAGVLFVGVFTLGTGLILAIPSVILINIAVSFAGYFQAKKQNFYCAENAIIKPL